MSDNVPLELQQGTSSVDESTADESIFSTGRLDRIELEHQLVIERHVNNLLAEKLKVAQLETANAEMKARIEKMEMQMQIDELKTTATADGKTGQASGRNDVKLVVVELEKKVEQLLKENAELRGELSNVGQNAADQAKLSVEELKKEFDEKLKFCGEVMRRSAFLSLPDCDWIWWWP